MSMNPSCQVCGMEDAEVVHCTNCECALVATLRARIAELEEGNVRRQVALEARIAELEREREHLSGRLTEVVTAWHASMASGARLREALEDFLNCPMVVSEGTSPVIVTIHVARERVEKWRAALASAPSAEPTPRDMRVAEAVRSACADCCDHDEGSTDRLRELDLAAVVAKAVRS